MPTRDLLAPTQRAQFTEIPEHFGEREFVRYYTLSPTDLAVIRPHRRPQNRLGFAVQLCYLRYPGRALYADEVVPEPLLAFIAAQLGCEPAAFADYARARDTTRREHLAEIREAFGFLPFDRGMYRALSHWLQPVVQATDNGVAIITALVEELRRRRVVAPALSTLERLGWEARRRAQQHVVTVLTGTLTDQQRAQLDLLLVKPADKPVTPLAWLRQPAGKPSPGTILGRIERLLRVRELELDATLARRVHQNRLRQLAREGMRYTPAALQQFPPGRRYATLVALLLERAAVLTDQILDLHNRLFTTYFRQCEHSQAQQIQTRGRPLAEQVRLYGRVGRALIDARENDADPYEAVEAVLPWERFVAVVAEAERLASPAVADALTLLRNYYEQMRRYAPELLATLTFQGAPTSKSLLQAIDVLRTVNAEGKKKLPRGAPLGFIKPRWDPLVVTPRGVDRALYEFCVLHELRQSLRAGDVWVTGSNQYRAFADYLLPVAAWKELRDRDEVPITLPPKAATWLGEQQEALHTQLTALAEQLSAKELTDVRLENNRIIVTGLSKAVPAEAEQLATQLYGRIRPIKITELLLAIDALTGFSRHFTHLHTGESAPNRAALFAAILADATNLGVSKMASACPGLSEAELAWVSDWYLRDEAYTKALADLVNAQHEQWLAQFYGTGTTSSSDGQRFPMGGRREAQGQVIARYGPDPSSMFYTHTSDRYAPFATRAIIANAHQAPYVLDGLLYHESAIQIEEHYTDTGGVSDHLFALCPPLGFRFCPRIRDLADRKLYTMRPPSTYPTLEPFIGGLINTKRISDHWDSIRHLATSLKLGTVPASSMLQKLAAYPRQNGLALALREMGRIERTLYTIRWYQEPPLRRRVTVGLNKGEARHALARAVCFHRRGMLQDRTVEDLQQRASGLNLVVAAITLWNTRALEQAIRAHQAAGEPLNEEYLQHVSPLAWEHIVLTGEYIWNIEPSTPKRQKRGRKPRERVPMP